MTDVIVDTLRLRGSHGRRLARVAARALPAALDRALADLGDVEVSSLRVYLDLDPEEYDDDTLAVLWADLVRAELIAGGAQGTVRRTASGGDAGPGRWESGAPMDLVAVARGWLSLPEDARTAVPAALLRLGDPYVATAVAAGLGPAEWSRLVESLRGLLSVPVPPAHPEAVGEGEDVAELEDPLRELGPEASAAPAPSPVADPSAVPDTAVPAPSASASVAEAADVLEVVGTLAELHDDVLTPLDPAAVTRAAGLALLYPWLEDHCHAAEVLHPGLDQYDVREAALAALVGDPTAVDDPLVRMLAGRAQLWEPPHDRFELPHQDEVDASAERVLASFASLLPGFERSTPEFVRSMWLVRLGVLELERYPALLTAATHPLDVLLPLLPYPVGLFRLPWSAALTVRFRP